MDLNAQRKNATREATSTLKAWLHEHIKNPYPTKGEKIMLAIITKMTLTQVSTWFANARRRLKKENKMVWSPRNRCEDGRDKLDSDMDDDDEEGADITNRENNETNKTTSNNTHGDENSNTGRKSSISPPPPPPSLLLPPGIDYFLAFLIRQCNQHTWGDLHISRRREI